MSFVAILRVSGVFLSPSKGNRRRRSPPAGTHSYWRWLGCWNTWTNYRVELEFAWPPSSLSSFFEQTTDQRRELIKAVYISRFPELRAYRVVQRRPYEFVYYMRECVSLDLYCFSILYFFFLSSFLDSTFPHQFREFNFSSGSVIVLRFRTIYLSRRILSKLDWTKSGAQRSVNDDQSLILMFDLRRGCKKFCPIRSEVRGLWSKGHNEVAKKPVLLGVEIIFLTEMSNKKR